MVEITFLKVFMYLKSPSKYIFAFPIASRICFHLFQHNSIHNQFFQLSLPKHLLPSIKGLPHILTVCSLRLPARSSLTFPISSGSLPRLVMMG